jgi:hypothetical protein
MPGNHSDVMDLVCRHLSAQEVENCRIYFDTAVKETGDSVSLGLREEKMPFRGIRVFIDLMPNANWGHRAAYLLASEDFKQSVWRESQFPPFNGDPPAGWVLLTRAG